MLQKVKFFHFIVILVMLSSFIFSPDLVKAEIDFKKSRKYSTPELIHISYNKNEIDLDTAHLYLARALQDTKKIPKKYLGEIPYDGTYVILELREALRTTTIKTSTANEISNIIDSFCGSGDIPISPYQLSNSISTEHFYIEYDDIFGGLSIQDYIDALDTTWNKQINEFGWATPPVYNANPAPNNLYHVRILDLPADLYGFVSNAGTHAGFVGDNPNTPWNDVDSFASCMVLNNNFEETVSDDPLKAAQSTIAHEFNHSIQYGYTGLSNSTNSYGIAPNSAFIEGGATWMEDEVFDDSNDNYRSLWVNFKDSLFFSSEGYPHWITFRGLTERFGSGTTGGSEQVMQDFWENISKGSSSEIEALDLALQNKGTNLSDAFQAYAIAVKYNKPCSGKITFIHIVLKKVQIM